MLKVFKAKNNFIALFVLVVFLCNACLLDISGSKPVARLSTNIKKLEVGGYCILDSEGSDPGEGDKLVYHWEEDENNPAKTIFCGWEKQYIGFTVEGTYKYYLTINNGLENSITKKVVISVNPRENIVFEDPALEAQVRCSLDMPTGELTDEILLNLERLQALTVYTRDIYSLNGIEKCTNLKYLGMGLQNIEDISALSALVNLEDLSLTQNRKIIDISALRNLTKLKKLDLMANLITDISPLSNLRELEYLHMTENPIEDLLPLSSLYNLEELWISYVKDNNLNFMPNLNKLTIFWMTSSDLDSIDYLNNKEALHAVNFSYNDIIDISPLKDLHNLELIYLRDNKVEDISALEGLINIQRIVLPGNNIIDILPLVNNPGLGEDDLLILSDNPLSDKSYNEYIPLLQSRGVIVAY